MRDLFAIRDLVVFLQLRIAMIFGAQILSVAVGWHIYEITGNPLALGLIGLFQFLPFLVTFLFAGLVADRLDRRLVLSLCNVLDAIAVTGVGLFLLSQPEQVWPVYILLALHATARTFTHPAQQAILPSLVPEHLFARAVALSSSVLKLGQLIGPAIGGVLVATIDRNTYFVAVLFLLLAAGFAYLIQTRVMIESDEPISRESLLGGFAHMKREPLVFAAISIDLAIVLFGSVMGLLPIFVQDILNAGPETLGILRAAPGLGALVVAIILARITPEFHMGRAFLVALLLFGVSILVFGVSTSLWISITALLIYGATDMMSVYVRMTLVQLRTPNELRGRVSSINSLSINASNELGDFRAGSMAAVIGPVGSVIVGGVMCLGTALLWWRLFPELRTLKTLT
ncbi:MAG: MFS transporter [Pseudomonadota bacterium]